MSLSSSFGTDFCSYILTVPDPIHDLAHKQAMRGRPNITTIHLCSEMCGKKPWYERTFCKTRLGVLQKCFTINDEWQSYLSGRIMSSNTSNTLLLLSSFNYRFVSAIDFKQCDNSCYIHLSPCFNLNCDWFYQITLSMYRKLRIWAHWHQIQVLSNNNW